MSNDFIPQEIKLRNQQQLDPVERYVPLVLKLIVYFILCLFFYQATETFSSYTPGQRWPSLLSFFRTWTFLPIHEAGHLLFSLFGRTLNILGGSLTQVALPFLWFLVAMKQRSHVAPFALFWVGENLMDVSLYVRDAPLRWLPLLGGHVSQHDWYNLLRDWDALDSAGPIADLLYWTGVLVSTASIGAGIYLAFRTFLKPKPFSAVTTPD